MTKVDRSYSNDDPIFRVDAALLIPGRGPSVTGGSVVFNNKNILYAGAQSQLPTEYSLIDSMSVNVIMPGLWDSHVHFLGATTSAVADYIMVPQALAGARIARDAAATLNAGYTSVRELGGYGVELSRAINEGWLHGPNIFSAVSPLSMTAGHGDGHSLPLELVKDQSCHGAPFHLCDGVEECLKAVRIQIRRGAKVIKVCTTGGITSLIDSPMAPQFSSAELKAMVEEAERADMIVAAHCHGKRGIMNALHAGVKTIEHGSFLDEEAINLMLDKDAMLVATRSITEWSLNHPGFFENENYEKLVAVADRNKQSYAMAIKAGVRIALGTDLGSDSPQVTFHHGTNGAEFTYAVEAGMTPAQAIEAGTANGPATLGPRAPLSGQLKAGYDADIIALQENPLEDITVLADVGKITHVWKGGKLCKSPEKPVSWPRL